MRKIRLSVLALASGSILCAVSSLGATFQEDFSCDPSTRGWKTFGTTNLFQWDATHHNLQVTWDSSQPNSYFYHPLGTVLAKEDGFSVEFDLQINDAQYTGVYEAAVGLFHVADATSPTFSRPAADAPNLFEFDYFPDDGSGEPNIAATMTDTTASATNWGHFYFIFDVLPMASGVTYHVRLNHPAGQAAIEANVFANGQLYSSMPLQYPAQMVDIRLDAFAVSSYSAAGDTWGDSILAHGTLANVLVTMPSPPVQQIINSFSNGHWQVQFGAKTNWLYTLERTSDLKAWADASAATPGVSGLMTLADTNSPTRQAFYRIRAERP